MARHDISARRIFGTGLALLAPTAVLLVGLAVNGRVDWGPVIATLTLTSGLTLLVLRLILSDARQMARHLEKLADVEHPMPPPSVATDTAEALLSGANRLHAAWTERLAAARGRLAMGDAMLEALPNPLLLIDSRRSVDLANAAARSLFGEAVVGRDLALALRAPAVLGAVEEVLAGGDARTVELTLPVPVERVLEARVKPFRRTARTAAGQDVTELVAILALHDITAIKRSEQMRADFVANASHELRTPLSTLVGFIETLRGPARDDPAAHDRFLSIMQEQAGRMARLVADLLSLSRIELDEHSPPQGEVDLARLVRSVAAMLELRAAARRIAIAIDGPESLPVTGDEDQLTQVVQNLVDNAVKYTRDGTEVTVRLERRAPGMAAVAVTDRGEGIARQHLPRLTERFYRVDPARSRQLGGTGLGLAIVKHIVNRHRGRLSIESEVGRGSTFTVTLPMGAASGQDGLRKSAE
ncbi:MAG TPA: phosphate regulon sensor histidine kinase PhoR [Azospirillaceae bacterium]|nr:phosphate regulon sensor histidine kinase PhoR [Azospirillaceae bacterium]